MNPGLVGVLGLVVLVLLMFLDVPVAFAMFITGFLGFSVLHNVQAALQLFPMEFNNTLFSYDMGVVILFTAMGALVGNTGIADRLFGFGHKMSGRLPGGLAVGTLASSALFGAVCGSSIAAAATFGKVALPEMEKHGYSDELATGVIACGGTLSSIIPPSLVFIMYGIVAQQSIGRLFISGLLPGLALTLLLILATILVSVIKPAWGPRGPSFSMAEKIRSMSGVLEALVLFVIVLGGIFAGIFTPTEAGAAGCAGAILISICRRTITWKNFMGAFADTARIAGMIFMIVIGASVFGRFITATNLGFTMMNWVEKEALSPQITFVIIILIFFIGGMFVDSIPLILILAPLMLPIVQALHYDLIWFGVLLTLLAQLGQLTPPVGTCVFAVKAVVPRVPVSTIYKGVMPFFPIYLLVCLLVLFFPSLVTWLPRLISY